MRIKKLLAITVIIAFAFSLVSTAIAAEQPVSYNYIFNSSAHNLGEKPTTADRRLTSGLHTVDNTVSSVSSPWGFVNAYGYNSLASYSEYVNWAIKDEDGAGVVFAPYEDSVAGVRAALAFEISASAGTYDASISVKHTGNENEIEVYLIPKNEYIFQAYDGNNADSSKAGFYNSVEKMSANYRIGKVDLYSEDLYIGRVELTEKDYYLVFVPCGANEAAAVNDSKLWAMQLTGFRLEGVGGSSEATNSCEFNPSNAFAYRNSGSSYTHSTENNVFSTSDIQVRRYGVETANGPFAAFRVSVDTSGKYNLGFKTNTVDPTQAATAVYLSKTATASDMQGITDKELVGYFDFSKLTADAYAEIESDNGELAELSLDADKDYYIVLTCDAMSIALNGKTTKKDLVSGVDYKVADNGTLQTMSGAVLTNSTHGFQKLYISGIKLTQVVEVSEEELERSEAYAADRELYEELTSVKAENNSKNVLDGYASAATVTIFAQDIATGASVAEIANESVAINAEYNPCAPSVGDDYEFLYWAAGLGVNRKIVSFDKDGYFFKASPGRNIVYAVYRKLNNDAKYAFFFDGSRTVMGRKEITNGKVTLPALPDEMPGFGKATGWKRAGEEDEAVLAPGAESDGLADDAFFVASYGDKKTVKITVDGTELDFDYGEEVNLGDYASIRESKNGYNVFNFWKKYDRIISFRPDYTFRAYEDCVISSTYAKYEPLDKTVRCILISADEKTGITFAEYIGLDSAIEKGIIFGTEKTVTYADASAKAVMQTDSDVFSVVNKTGEAAIGYAILDDGTIVYSDR